MRATSCFGSRRDNIPPLFTTNVNWLSPPDNDRVVRSGPRRENGNRGRPAGGRQSLHRPRTG